MYGNTVVTAVLGLRGKWVENSLLFACAHCAPPCLWRFTCTYDYQLHFGINQGADSWPICYQQLIVHTMHPGTVHQHNSRLWRQQHRVGALVTTLIRPHSHSAGAFLVLPHTMGPHSCDSTLGATKLAVPKTTVTPGRRVEPYSDKGRHPGTALSPTCALTSARPSCLAKNPDDGRHPRYPTGRKSLFSRYASAGEPRPCIVQTQRSCAHRSSNAAKPPSHVRALPVHPPRLPGRANRRALVLRQGRSCARGGVSHEREAITCASEVIQRKHPAHSCSPQVPYAPPKVVTVDPLCVGWVGLHHTLIALKLQQFQYNPKKIFLQCLQCLVFPVLFGPSEGPPPQGGGGGGGFKGA